MPKDYYVSWSDIFAFEDMYMYNLQQTKDNQFVNKLHVHMMHDFCINCTVHPGFSILWIIVPATFITVDNFYL